MSLPVSNEPGYVDGATIEADLALAPQVCIVGSGAGGAVAAAVLAEAGYEVLVVEEGGRYTRRDFKQREDEAYPKLYQEDGGRSTEDLAISVLHGRAVGGSTVVNWTTSFRTPEDVVGHWRDQHEVKGFSYADLVPHWESAEARLNIAEMPLAEANRNNRALWDGCTKLGWEVKPLHRNVKGCLKTGSCGFGCPADAKQSMLLTYLPDAVAKGAKVLSRCRIDRLELVGGAARRLEGILLGPDDRTPTGRRVSISPRFVILSGGGINTPAILLRSGFPLEGRVGARTFLHPTIAGIGLYDDAILGWSGAPQSVASHQFAHRGDDVGYVLETAAVHPMLAAMAAPGLGAAHADLMKRLPFMAGFVALTVDGFHGDVPGGRVKLRASGAPVLDYPVAPKLLEAMRDASRNMAKLHFAAGAKVAMTPHDPPRFIERPTQIDQVIGSLPWEPNRFSIFSLHVMGGAGMNDDRTRGVVRSEDLRVHGLANVHVIDGSVFPTSLGVNPQLSIYGLAHLVATRLAGRWGAA